MRLLIKRFTLYNAGKEVFRIKGVTTSYDCPDEKDEFVDCTINAGMVYFGAKCTAIATNCIFNLISVNGTSNPIFGMNWYDTQNSVTLNNVVINVDSVATSPLIIAYKPGLL